ncbi:MAG: hypothetical protein GX846_00890 [Deltaproteobacteria bacterium]|nr:hypothetical protein [Deltaproteobacteria bacterium]
MKQVRPVSVCALFFLLALFPIFANASVEEEIKKQYPLERDGEVQVKNISGKIVVTTWDRNEVKIRARKTASSQKVLGRINIEIDAYESSININTGYDKSFNSNFPFSIFSSENWSVDYEMTVPDMAEISLGSVSGNIRVNSVGGALKVESVSGEIKVVSVGKNVRAKSVSGEIYLEGIAGDTHAETVSGRISANEIRGEVFAKTVNGVKFHNKGRKLRVKDSE